MARRGKPKEINWYLREWMDACGLSGRGAQAEMMRRTDWSKATMSQLYNGQQDYNPEILKVAAEALHAETWELLMPPERAFALRQYRASAAEVVKIGEVRADAMLAKMREERDKDPDSKATGTHGK